MSGSLTSEEDCPLVSIVPTMIMRDWAELMLIGWSLRVRDWAELMLIGWSVRVRDWAEPTLAGGSPGGDRLLGEG